LLHHAEQKNRIQIWLYDQVNTRIEGDISVRGGLLLLVLVLVCIFISCSRDLTST
jgi:hypothetical protein